MTVKAVLKHYSMASEGKVKIIVNGGDAHGEHIFTGKGINDLIENDAPLLKMTFGMVMVKDGNLVITAY